ncbi:hypothetical protein RRG08_024188 [Elysia crispata]|uniref:Uncharacterized protein n=1 Tax=Elysia crispata TaxID=231223 RepID=A0AAE1D2R2_9GAST|nr:hypothetical protein RRG08_024188 [Elysia crispata]
MDYLGSSLAFSSRMKLNHQTPYYTSFTSLGHLGHTGSVQPSAWRDQKRSSENKTNISSLNLVCSFTTCSEILSDVISLTPPDTSDSTGRRRSTQFNVSQICLTGTMMYNTDTGQSRFELKPSKPLEKTCQYEPETPTPLKPETLPTTTDICGSRDKFARLQYRKWKKKIFDCSPQ